jgi:peptidoglycan glycosyltransferase
MVGGGKVTNFGGAGYGTATVEKALRSSINTVFAGLGVALGPQRLVDQARAFGFDARIPFELPVTTSVMPIPSEMSVWETAWAADGQPVGAHLVKGPVTTAMQMALVVAGLANNGVVMRPYLVDHIADATGAPTLQAEPTALSTATDPTTAATVRRLMVGVVESGSGGRAKITGVKIAGKTGTAEVGAGLDTDAWFVAFGPAAPGDTPRIAVAVVFENAGLGGTLAAPAARAVLLEALKR